jgi:branched-subunit amino acid aminotransferase/4-amino-4-deoxychorismate lyase
MHPQAKTLGSVICFESKQYAVKNGSYESILVTPEDQVLEGSYSNLFWVREGQLFTNSAGVLPGITRQTVIGLSGQCHFEEIHLAELKLCDEIFLTQTTTGILPVRSIEGERVGGDEAPGGFPGPVTRGLMKRFDGMTRSQKTE